MTDKPVPAPKDVYETARSVEYLAGNLNFEQAYGLARLVLQHHGGPVPRTGRRALIQPRVSAALERRGFVERGGDQNGRRVRVQSVLNFRPDGTDWSAAAPVVDQGRIGAVICASDEGIDLVARGWRLARGVSTPEEPERSQPPEEAQPPALPKNEEPSEELMLRPVLGPFQAFDADGRVAVPPLEYVVEAVMCQYGPEGSPSGQEQSFVVAICLDVPDCDAGCCENAARFDMRVANRRGAGWANLCAVHAHEAGLELLGVGRGSYLLHPDELRSEHVRGELAKLGMLGVLVHDEEGDEATWSRIYRGLGFAQASSEKLVRRSGAVSVVAHHLGAGRVGIDLRETRAYRVPGLPDSFDAVVPDWWGEELVRELLRHVVGSRAVRAGGWEDLDLTLAAAVEIVGRGLLDGDRRTRLHEFLGEPERFAISTLVDSPFQRASRVTVEQSKDWDLLARVYQLHADTDIRAMILMRDDCPVDLLLGAAADVIHRGTLLRRATLPDEVVEPLFTRLATSSTAAEGSGRMLQAATHPLTPMVMVEAFVERALAERDDRLAVLEHAEGLDAERQAILRAAVLRRTHRGRTQDEVMTRLLGDQGVFNQPVMVWVQRIDHRPTRMRASAWIAARVEASRAELETEFERRRDEAVAIVRTWDVGADGRYNMVRSQYDAYKNALTEAKRLQDLLTTLPAPLSPR